MTDSEQVHPFHAQYVAALRYYLVARDEDSLSLGSDFGRRALQEQISMLDIIEHHFRLTIELGMHSESDRAASLAFLFQTLEPLDVATRGFLDGTKRYAEQHARAEGLADREKFRTALVNSLQEGFFVADHTGAIVEMNNAFAEILGYPPEDLPYPWPQPWLVDRTTAIDQTVRLRTHGSVAYDMSVRRRDGHLAWVTVRVNAVSGTDKDENVYVGTIRDITAERAFAAREGAVLRLATAVGVAKSVAEVLRITLDECRTPVDVRRVVAATWAGAGGEPTVQVAGEPEVETWRGLDPWLQTTLQDARRQLPLTAKTIDHPDAPGKALGLVAVLSGAADVALWLELGAPRLVSAEDRLLVTVLVGHLSLAMRHVRQFENARETSLTLQRAMLPPVKPPPGFVVRYEPAVSPLEIGGDWYDVVPIGDHGIGIVVGDCVGRGLPAAAIMGQLRSSARALLLTGAQPAVLLEQLDAAASLIPNAYCTTVFLAILDTESGILQYSNAGHMPALLVGADPDDESGITVLADARSVPLAVRRSEPRAQSTLVLPPGSTMMLFTDGLVERRREAIDDGIDRAAAVLVDMMALPLEAVADTLLRRLSPEGGYDDDVAMVLYRHQHAPLRIECDAVADNLADIRHRLTGWLNAANVPDELAFDVVLVANEACTNSVEHAYRGRPTGMMSLQAETVETEVRVRVGDSGSWQPPASNPGNGGRGLLLMRAICDSLEVDRGPHGTTVVATFGLAAGVETV